VGGESGPGRAERKLVERCWHDESVDGGRQSAEYCGVEGVPHLHSLKPPNDDADAWHHCPKPQALEWVRSLRDQCVAAGVPFFFKQWAGPRPSSAGALIDGKEWRQMP